MTRPAPVHAIVIGLMMLTLPAGTALTGGPGGADVAVPDGSSVPTGPADDALPTDALPIDGSDPAEETGRRLARWYRPTLQALDAEPAPAPEGPDGYVASLDAYVEATGATLSPDSRAAARTQADALTPLARDALTDLLHALTHRQRVAEDLTASARDDAPDPANVRDAVAAQHLVLDATSSVLAVLEQGAITNDAAQDPEIVDSCYQDLDLTTGVRIDLGTTDDTLDCDYALLVDLGGDDAYLGNAGGADGLEGPIAAYHLDAAGDDRYVREESASLGHAGGARIGLGGLVDVRGRDVYDVNLSDTPEVATTGSATSVGSGFLFDLAGDDRYRAENLYKSAAHGSVYEGSAGFLVDLAGDDRYTGHGPHIALNGASYAEYWPAYATLVDGAGNDIYTDDTFIEDEYCEGDCGAINGAVKGDGDAILADLSGDDVYRACKALPREEIDEDPPVPHANGHDGLLYDLEGHDTYSEGLSVHSYWHRHRYEDDHKHHYLTCAEAYSDQTRMQKGYGHQIDRFGTGAPLSEATFLVTPQYPVAAGPGQACSPDAQVLSVGVDDACTEDPFVLYRKTRTCGAEVLASAAHPGQGDPTSLCSDVDDDPASAPLATDGDETQPHADEGRAFWLRDGRLFTQNVLTQTVGPIVADDDVQAYAADGGTVAWRSADDTLYLENVREGLRIEIGTATGEVDFDGHHVVWERDDDVCAYDVTRHRQADLVKADSDVCLWGERPRVSGDHIAYVDSGDAEVVSINSGEITYLSDPDPDVWRDVEIANDNPTYNPVAVTGVDEVAIDGDLVAWKGKVRGWYDETYHGVLAAHLQAPDRVVAVGQTGGVDRGLDIGDTFVVWSKRDKANNFDDAWGELEDADKSVVVGRDVAHMMPSPETKTSLFRFEEDQACAKYPWLNGNWYWYCEGHQASGIGTDHDGILGSGEDRREARGASAGINEVVISEQTAPNHHAIRPRVSSNLVTWTECETTDGWDRCSTEGDAYYAHLLGPHDAGASTRGGLENCYNTAEPENAPDTLASTAVAAPDLNDDDLGDCWAGYYAQALGEMLERLQDHDCDTLSVLQEFRWQTQPLYDVPPVWCADTYDTEPQEPDLDDPKGQELFPNGRDIDMDYLLDGYEARYIERANGGGPLTAGQALDDLAGTADGAASASALYHPLKDHDTDGDDIRDMEDPNSDSHVSDANPVADTVLDGIEVWALGSFPDHGDSDCSLDADVCHNSSSMVWERDDDEHDVQVSQDRGSGDGLSDSAELLYWTVLVGDDLPPEEAFYREETCAPSHSGCHVDEIDNVLLDPDVDGNYPDAQEFGEALTSCLNGLDIPVAPQELDQPPGQLVFGGLRNWTLTAIVEDLRETFAGEEVCGYQVSPTGSNAQAVGVPATLSCFDLAEADTDGDGVLDSDEAPTECQGVDP